MDEEKIKNETARKKVEYDEPFIIDKDF